MNDSPPLPSKRDVCVALLERSSVFVHLDPRKEGVVVPPWFRKQPQLVLQVGYQMKLPIPDLTVGDEALTGTLSFSRSPFACTIPWSSVFALVSGEDARGMVWPPDVPPEVAAQMQAPKPAASEAPAKPAKKPRASRKAPPASEAPTPTPTPLPAVAPAPARAEASRSDPPSPRAPSESPSKPKRELPPYLRVIK
jgi:stringent starvation protein B